MKEFGLVKKTHILQPLKSLCKIQYNSLSTYYKTEEMLNSSKVLHVESLGRNMNKTTSKYFTMNGQVVCPCLLRVWGNPIQSLHSARKDGVFSMNICKSSGRQDVLDHKAGRIKVGSIQGGSSWNRYLVESREEEQDSCMRC